MGWKASCILINEREPGFLGTMPPHDSERARRLITDLGIAPHRSRGMTTFDEGIYPDQLVIGAYDGAAVIGAPSKFHEFEPMAGHPLIPRILRTFPQAAVLVIGLHSVVNLFYYSYFESGKLLRAYGGAAECGVMLDVGPWLPEERPHFERSVVRDGMRYFLVETDGQKEEYNAPAFGEDLVFELMAKFFGCRPDRVHPKIEPGELAMESFERVKPRWWWPFKAKRAQRSYLGWSPSSKSFGPMWDAQIDS
jgi:hypothetical protein